MSILKTYKKITCTLIAVLVTFCLFPNNDKEDPRFFVKEATQITNTQQIHPSPFAPMIQGIIYVKEKTIFHVGTNTTVKVVYLSGTKTLGKNEQLLTIVPKAIIQAAKRQPAIIRSTTPKNLPLKRGGAVYYINGYGIVLSLFTTQQTSKKTTSFKKHTNNKHLQLQTVVAYNEVYTARDIYKTPHKKTPVLSSYYSLPPPANS